MYTLTLARARVCISVLYINMGMCTCALHVWIMHLLCVRAPARMYVHILACACLDGRETGGQGARSVRGHGVQQRGAVVP